MPAKGTNSTRDARKFSPPRLHPPRGARFIENETAGPVSRAGGARHRRDGEWLCDARGSANIDQAEHLRALTLAGCPKLGSGFGTVGEAPNGAPYSVR